MIVPLWLVNRIMVELDFKAVQPRVSKKTTIVDPDAPTRPDLVRRQFYLPVAITTPVGDITYLRIGEG